MIEVDTVRRLHVLAECDPGVLLRVLERFANLNIVPNRLNAVCGLDEIRIEIEMMNIPTTTCALIAAKIGQLPTVFDARLEEVERSR